MIDPDTPKALRAIASMMRMEGYRTDATGVEALVLDNAADEIELLGRYSVAANESEVKFRNLLAEAKAENKNLRDAVNLAIYELHFVADEHDCEQCREAAKNIMKIAKGGSHD